MREWQAKAAFNLIIDYGTANDLAGARALYDALEKLGAAHADEPALRKLQAKEAVNLITAYGTANDLAGARALYDPLEKLAAAHAGEPALRKLQAEAAVNLINAYGATNDLASARDLARRAEDYLLSGEFLSNVRNSFGELRAAQFQANLRSLIEE